jgi:hypothetical protein
MYILGLLYHIEHVSEQLANIWNEASQAKNEARNIPSDIMKPPDPYKKDTKWRQWKGNVIRYLDSKRGQGGIPLSYIIRENDVPQIHIVHATVHEQLVNCAILHGSEFNTNNGMVYDYCNR